MGLIIGLICGYLFCHIEYKTAIERWNYDCSVTRTDDWRKATHNHD
jgi:hypothetical protein